MAYHPPVPSLTAQYQEFSPAELGLSALGITVIVAIAILWLVLVVLWTILPFAVFGIKGLLRDLIKEQHRTNRLLESLHTIEELKASRQSGETSSSK